MNTIHLIYIGDFFYTQSGTTMSSLYQDVGGEWQRYDWGFVQRALREGNKVDIRPATDTELGKAYRMMAALKEKSDVKA